MLFGADRAGRALGPEILDLAMGQSRIGCGRRQRGLRGGLQKPCRACEQGSGCDRDDEGKTQAVWAHSSETSKRDVGSLPWEDQMQVLRLRLPHNARQTPLRMTVLKSVHTNHTMPLDASAIESEKVLPEDRQHHLLSKAKCLEVDAQHALGGAGRVARVEGADCAEARSAVDCGVR